MKEKFKTFVKNNPSLIDYVKNNHVSWQSLYEVYSLYGEDDKVWDKYTKNNTNGIEELIKLFKNVNLDNLKNIIDGLQKAVGLIQELTSNEEKQEDVYEYKQKYEDLDD